MLIVHKALSHQRQGSPLYLRTTSSLHSIKESSIKFHASPHWTQVSTHRGWQVFFFSCATPLRSCLCTTDSNIFSKLILAQRFSRTGLFVSVFFCFWFDFTLNTQQGCAHYKSLLWLLLSLTYTLLSAKANLSLTSWISDLCSWLSNWAWNSFSRLLDRRVSKLRTDALSVPTWFRSISISRRWSSTDDSSCKINHIKISGKNLSWFKCFKMCNFHWHKAFSHYKNSLCWTQIRSV